MVVDVVADLAREGVLSELLCADDLILMSETIEDFRIKLMKCESAFESKDWKLRLGKQSDCRKGWFV